ncbi:MAG: thermonuclease family protein [Magnetovibrio sp.]|nr:thermonuclease family protein [Magnetovibrio sp.]
MSRRHLTAVSAGLLAVLGFVLAGLAGSAAAADRTVGRAEVVSGDTLIVAGQRIRLFGIDAPELGQRCQWPNKEIDCGNVSRTALLDLIAPVAVACARRDTAADGTWIGTCKAEGFDVGTNLVHTGWAVVSPGDPAGYAAIQEKARAAKRGLWRGTFQMPWEWRKTR